MKTLIFNHFSWLVIGVLLGLSADLNAQDTIRRHPIKFITEDQINNNRPLFYTDSSQSDLEILHPLYQRQVVFQDLGNIGTASRNMVDPFNRPIGFVGSTNPYEPYFIDGSKTRYYNSTVPFTELFYAQGKQDLLFLKAKHSQNILPRWSVGIDFQRLTSVGFMQRQKTSYYNTQFNTRYFSKNKRYELIGYVLWNRAIVQENGGIGSDSAFEALSGINKSVQVNLNASENRIKNRSAFIKQYYKFGSPIQLIRGEDTLYDFKSNFQLAYTLKAEETSSLFINNGDSLSTLLPNRYHSLTNETYDSLYNGLLNNRLELYLHQEVPGVGKRYFAVGLIHQMAAVGQPAFIRNYQNIIADLNINWFNFRSNSFSYWLKANYVASGFNNGDYLANGLISYKAKFPIDFFVSGQQQAFKPDYNLLKFSSNQFVWDNNFKQVQVTTFQLFINTRGFRNNFSLNVAHHLVNNYVYLNNTLLPEQATEMATLTRATLSKTFQLGKFFFNHKVIWQQSNAKYLPVPEIGGAIRYYFQSKLFSSKIQIGFDAFYNSSYYGLSWSPASRMFYVQDNVKIGNYVLVDPFLNMEISSFVFFAKFEHVNQNLVNEGFYSTPHHPLSLQAFRFGARWRMYN